MKLNGTLTEGGVWIEVECDDPQNFNHAIRSGHYRDLQFKSLRFPLSTENKNWLILDFTLVGKDSKPWRIVYI